MTDSYFTIEKTSSFEIKINKSTFISQAFPFKSQLEIPELIKAVKKKYYDASHHPYAFRAGLNKNSFRSSDDGEPSGSSGKPVLEAIDKHKLTDILVVVTRYFGGIKLGVGGLRRAYFEAADECLNNAKKIEKFITEIKDIVFDYKYMNLIMKLIEDEKIGLIENNSGEKCSLKLDIRLSLIDKIKNSVSKITNGSAEIS